MAVAAAAVFKKGLPTVLQAIFAVEEVLEVAAWWTSIVQRFLGQAAKERKSATVAKLENFRVAALTYDGANYNLKFRFKLQPPIGLTQEEINAGRKAVPHAGELILKGVQVEIAASSGKLARVTFGLNDIGKDMEVNMMLDAPDTLFHVTNCLAGEVRVFNQTVQSQAIGCQTGRYELTLDDYDAAVKDWASRALQEINNALKEAHERAKGLIARYDALVREWQTGAADPFELLRAGEGVFYEMKELEGYINTLLAQGEEIMRKADLKWKKPVTALAGKAYYHPAAWPKIYGTGRIRSKIESINAQVRSLRGAAEQYLAQVNALVEQVKAQLRQTAEKYKSEVLRLAREALSYARAGRRAEAETARQRIHAALNQFRAEAQAVLAKAEASLAALINNYNKTLANLENLSRESERLSYLLELERIVEVR